MHLGGNRRWVPLRDPDMEYSFGRGTELRASISVVYVDVVPSC